MGKLGSGAGPGLVRAEVTDAAMALQVWMEWTQLIITLITKTTIIIIITPTVY